jgi:hypothetical protein
MSDQAGLLIWQQSTLRSPFTVVDAVSGATACGPDVVLVGRQTRNRDLVSTGSLAMFTVHFEPTRFHRLFHMRLAHTADSTPAAEDVLGPEMRVLHERLRGAKSPGEMADHVEQMLERRLNEARPLHPVQAAAVSMLTRPGLVPVQAMAASCDLSVRQFERAFLVQTLGQTNKIMLRYHYELVGPPPIRPDGEGGGTAPGALRSTFGISWTCSSP